MQKTEELVVITKTYDLILWSCNHTSRLHELGLFAPLLHVLLQSRPNIVYAGLPEPPLHHLRSQPVRALRLTLFFKDEFDGVNDRVNHASASCRFDQKLNSSVCYPIIDFRQKGHFRQGSGMPTEMAKQFRALWESSNSPPDLFAFLEQHSGSDASDKIRQ